MGETNFLIGRGELLTFDIKSPGGGGEKKEVYTLQEAKIRLRPQFVSTSKELDSLSDMACPEDIAVARFTINPSFIAKSYFPHALLRTMGLEAIGSRGRVITPNKWSKTSRPEPVQTTDLFVAGKRASFRDAASWLDEMDSDAAEAIDIRRIENIAAYNVGDKLQPHDSISDSHFEIGVHLLPSYDSRFIQISFARYAENLGILPYLEMGFQAGNLWFLPVKAEEAAVRQLAQFSFVRVVRPVPKLRGVKPLMSRGASVHIACDLPIDPVISEEPKVAILDGGLPDVHPIAEWVSVYRKLDPSANDDADASEHGLAVSSAFLFGSITPSETARIPYSKIDHYRVLDNKSGSEDPLELYRTLGFIEQILLSRQYEFINLSLGPDLPIEDTDVHAWTSVIDELLSDGATFMAMACGNNGERDHASGNARVQVPSDCVNAVAVGSADCPDDVKWKRASYSAIGPGRSPGIVKPDLMAFGGGANQYFHVLSAKVNPTLEPILGTSFASPYLLRSAVGIRAILGESLTPLAIKALLVHQADPKDIDVTHVGWGKVPEDVDSIITCPRGVARIVYKGELKPGKYLRARLPIPKAGLSGMVKIKATFCYSCAVDPQDASAYTRAGLDIVFRPKNNVIKPGKAVAETRPFFSPKKYATEQEQRSDFGKWETVLHGEKRMRGSSLDEPVFDIRYNARQSGGKATRPDKIPYALVITIEAAKHLDLYNDVLRSYANVLTPIRPQVSLPIKT